MKTLRVVLAELVGLFVDDGSLAVALLLLVGLAAGLSQIETLRDTIAGGVLVVGVLLVFAENLLRRAGRQQGRRRLIGTVAAVLLLPAILLGGWAGGLQLVGNIHAVEPGRLYRSAQLDGTGFKEVIGSYGIRTVVNLRGENPGQRWYDEERAAVSAAGVAHYDIALSARQEPDESKLRRLMTILRTAPQPILVHCQSGSDRTGLAAALYELEVMGKPPEEAGGQLSFYYGHFPWLGSRTVAMDRTFSRIAAEPAGARP